MMSLLRVLVVGAVLFGLSTPAWAQGPSTTIVNNGNHNINIVLNIQGPTINIPPPPLLGLPPVPPGFGPSLPPPLPGFVPPAQNLIFNQGHGNHNHIFNRGAMVPSHNTIVNVGHGNVNRILNRGR
jgi:hypothetical protein